MYQMSAALGPQLLLQALLLLSVLLLLPIPLLLLLMVMVRLGAVLGVLPPQPLIQEEQQQLGVLLRFSHLYRYLKAVQSLLQSQSMQYSMFLIAMSALFQAGLVAVVVVLLLLLPLGLQAVRPTRHSLTFNGYNSSTVDSRCISSSFRCSSSSTQ